MDKYFDASAQRKIERLRKLKGYFIATTNGCFDLLHAGHVQSLRTCLKQPGIPNLTALIVLMNSDASIRAIKGAGRPVYCEDHRLYMVRSIRGVAGAFLFGDKTPESCLKMIRPDYHFKGDEWAERDVPELDYVGKMVFLPHIHDVSTTMTIEAIKGNAFWRTRNGGEGENDLENGERS